MTSMKRTAQLLACLFVGMGLGWYLGYTRPTVKHQRELLGEYRDIRNNMHMTDAEMADAGKKIPGYFEDVKRQDDTATVVALSAFVALQQGDKERAKARLLHVVGSYYRLYHDKDGDPSIMAKIQETAQKYPELAAEISKKRLRMVSTAVHMSRTLRYLRVGFSTTCGIVCLLLVLLWVRSYWRIDWMFAHIPNDNWTVYAVSFMGRAGVDIAPQPRAPWEKPGLSLGNRPVEEWGGTPRETVFYQLHWRSGFHLGTPYWILVGIVSAFTLLPWIRWNRRFSLRTLLVAITLMAVVLGAAFFYSPSLNGKGHPPRLVPMHPEEF